MRDIAMCVTGMFIGLCSAAVAVHQGLDLLKTSEFMLVLLTTSVFAALVGLFVAMFRDEG